MFLQFILTTHTGPLEVRDFQYIRTLICSIHHFFEQKVEVLTSYNQERNKCNYKKMAEECLP